MEASDIFSKETVPLITFRSFSSKISSSLNISCVFHWFRKVLVSELLTNGISVYTISNNLYEGFKMSVAL